MFSVPRGTTHTDDSDIEESNQLGTYNQVQTSVTSHIVPSQLYLVESSYGLLVLLFVLVMHKTGKTNCSSRSNPQANDVLGTIFIQLEIWRTHEPDRSCFACFACGDELSQNPGNP